jgi:hypothetical protein
MNLDEIESIESALGEVYCGLDEHLTLATAPPQHHMEDWARRLAAALDLCASIVYALEAAEEDDDDDCAPNAPPPPDGHDVRPVA